MADNTAFMYPGQGAYLGSVFTDLARRRSEVREIFAEIDDALTGIAEPVSPLLFDSAPPLHVLLAEHPLTLQLALYGTAVAIDAILTGEGVRPTVTIGHSLGEIAALAAAKALSIGDGAVVVARRTEALAAAAPEGGMLAVGAGAHRVAALLEAIADPALAVAVVNGPRQVVVSGPAAALTLVAELAGRIGVPVVAVDAPYAFHNPGLAPAAERFHAGIRQLRPRPLHRAVYSPILGRYYRDGDDLAELLAGHLTRRVDFSGALHYLTGAGIDRFVECGARDALTGIVRNTVPNVVAIAPVGRGSGAIESLAGLLGTPAVPETATVPLAAGHPEALAERPAPDRTGVLTELIQLYAAAVEYPVDVFSESVELEADLGIDSVKQTELLSRVAERYGLPPVSDDFRIADYGTLGHITDLIVQTGHSAAPGAPPPAAAAIPDRIDRAGVLTELIQLYAAAVEYPVDVFSESVELEADLGIDSVKQTELLSRVAERYGLPPVSDDFRIADFGTLGRIADLVAVDRAAVAA